MRISQRSAVPDWHPNWLDVVFDHAAATAAAEQCRAAARSVDGALAGLVGLPATDHWIGRYKDEWEADQAPTADDLRGTADDLRALATAIETAAGEARTEQQHRVAERERWREEARADGTLVPASPTGPMVPR